MSGSWLENAKPFVIGGLSGCTATFSIHPIDTVKVRIQVRGEEAGLAAKAGKKLDTSVSTVIKEVLASDGPIGFYRGQVVYGTMRLGLYRFCSDKAKAKNGGKDLSLLQKIWWSSFSGVCAVVVGNPPDICLIRFQSDSMLPPDQRRNYKNAIDALIRIAREEGVTTLWRGSVTNCGRAVSMNVGMLATYDEAKERVMKFQGATKETMPIRLISSCLAGFCCSFFSLPFDNCKTKIQKMKPGADGKLPYKGIVDVLTKTIANEGITGLWIGFPVYYTRVAPHAMIALLVQDYLTNFAKRYQF